MFKNNSEDFQVFYNLYIKELEYNIDWGMCHKLTIEIDNNFQTNEMYEGLFSEINDLIDEEMK